MSLTIQRLSVTGMTCSGCADAVTRVLSRVPGVADVGVTLEPGRAEVVGNASLDALLGAVRKAGYAAEALPA